MELPAYKIAEVICAKNHKSASDQSRISCLLTDSRDLTYPDKTVFFALKTKVNDGHLFIPELYERGVRRFVIDEPIDAELYPEATFWQVDSVLEALQRLGAAVRAIFKDIPVVGITGSRGKTTVKEMIFQALSPEFDIVRSPRSYNSQIGVPLLAWEMTPTTEIAVFECGISEPNEMEKLEKIIKPNVGVFTTLTDEHSDGFENLRQKAKEKAQLFQDCKRIYIENDMPHLELVKEEIKKINPNAAIAVVNGGNKSLADAVIDHLLTIKGDTEYQAKAFEIIDHISEPISSRIDVTETLKNCVIVYDSFTNDLRSIHDALNYTVRHLTPGRHLTLILTEPNTPMTNRALKDVLKAKGVERIICIGDSLSDFKSESIKVETVADVAAFVEKYTISDFADEVILVKGTQGSGAEEIKTLLEAPRHETIMEVDLGAITQNFNFFRSKINPSTGIVCMVKAAGYGVGALELAKTLQNQGAAYLAVAVIDEGVELRRAGITMPILVMNPIGTNYKALFDNKLEPSIFSMRELQLLLTNAKRLGIHDYPVHIKLDTGMHRLGFLESEIDELIDTLNHQQNVKVASIFSHLATADCLDEDEYTETQLKTFERMSSNLQKKLPYSTKRHILNTAGILRYPKYQYDMVRLGIGLYGVAPIEGYKLQPVARLLSTIISLKTWDEGTTIGYGRRGKISSPTVIATVPIGYADGMDRHLSNGAAYVLVNGKECKIVGNICMDQCMVDVTDANASIGDTVEIFGENAPIERLSDTLGTIPYEILTSISGRVKRIYFRE